jgi:hypothetical protein
MNDKDTFGGKREFRVKFEGVQNMPHSFPRGNNNRLFSSSTQHLVSGNTQSGLRFRTAKIPYAGLPESTSPPVFTETINQ